MADNGGSTRYTDVADAIRDASRGVDGLEGRSADRVRGMKVQHTPSAARQAISKEITAVNTAPTTVSGRPIEMWTRVIVVNEVCRFHLRRGVLVGRDSDGGVVVLNVDGQMEIVLVPWVSLHRVVRRNAEPGTA